MSKPHKLSLRSIVAASVASPIEFDVGPAPTTATSAPTEHGGSKTLKERAKQMSVYLEPPVYDQLRDIAHVERTKIHPLMLEALDLLFKKRGARSIRQLTSAPGR